MPRVVFELEKNLVQDATSCWYSAEQDFALLEVPLQAAPGAFQGIRAPRPKFEQPGNMVSFLAREGGYGAGRIVWNDATSSEDGPELKTGGLGVLPGFSGGAVIDEEGALAGMVLSTSNVSTTSLRWLRITRILDAWNVRPSEDLSPIPPDDTFRNNSYQPALEPARDAVREYRRLLNLKDGEALLRLYPTLSRGSVDALFGDTVSIEFRLSDCEDRDADSRLSCQYHMTIVRRTGPRLTYPSPCPEDPCSDAAAAARRLVFTLAEDRATARWQIQDVEEGTR
jgi:hypothetical protein